MVPHLLMHLFSVHNTRHVYIALPQIVMFWFPRNCFNTLWQYMFLQGDAGAMMRANVASEIYGSQIVIWLYIISRSWTVPVVGQAYRGTRWSRFADKGGQLDISRENAWLSAWKRRSADFERRPAVLWFSRINWQIYCLIIIHIAK